jgi:hypothetical protein
MASYTINYAETPFTIEEYQYGYDEIRRKVFRVDVSVIAPESGYKDVLTISMELYEMLDILEQFNGSLVKYIRSVIDGFKGKPKPELRAFESLDFDEDFDMHALLANFVSKMKLTYTEPEEGDEEREYVSL